MKVEVRCPSCSKKGYIEVSEEKIKSVSRGLIAVNVSKDIVCKHTFVTYVDKNLKIRDSFIADFQIELPEFDSSTVTVKDKAPKKEKVDVVLIKLNLPASLLAYILQGIFRGGKILLLNNQPYLHDHIRGFVDYITNKSFRSELTILPHEEYVIKRKDFKDYIILEGNEIVQDKEELLELKNLNVERTIIQKFLAETDETSSLIIIKNEMTKAYSLADTLLEFVNNFEGKEIQSKLLIDHIAETHEVQIKMPYLNFLISIVENYYNLKVPLPSEVGNFLGFL